MVLYLLRWERWKNSSSAVSYKKLKKAEFVFFSTKCAFSLKKGVEFKN